MNGAAALEYKSVSKAYPVGFRTKEALVNINLKIPQGKATCLIGANGCGKSTLLRLAMGLLRPTAGEVWIQNQSATHKASRKKVGFLAEAPSFPPFLTGRQVLAFCARLKNATDSVEVASRFDVSLESPVRAMSKGMLQRLALANAFLGAPNLVLLDEPSNGLDPIGRRYFKAYVKEFVRTGNSLLFSSHHFGDLELCDWVVLLRFGRQLWEGNVEAFMSLGTELSQLEDIVYGSNIDETVFINQ